MTGTHTKPTLTHEEAKQAVFQYLREVEGLGLPKENIEAGINAILRLAGIADVYPAAK